MKPTKLKRGKAMLYNGTPVWVQLDMGGGFVLICYSQSRALTDQFEWIETSNLTEVVKARTGLKNQPQTLTKKEKSDKQLMNDFYWSLWDKIPVNCMECGQPLQVYNAYARRSVSSHILPKSSFESVARCEDNILFLGASFLGGCACHDKYDSNVDNRRSMKVYPLALERFKQFAHLLTDKELVDAEKYLGL